MSKRDMSIEDAVGDLIGRIGLNQPIWPCPRYPQDVAMLAFAITDQNKTIARLKRAADFARDMAEGDCEYGDSCPEFGSRHGRCVSCKARAALEGK